MLKKVCRPFCSSPYFMPQTASNLDEFIGNVLRGAAKILGCNSTNLIVITEKTKQIRIRVGITAVDQPILAQFENILGGSFKGLSFPIDAARDSLIVKVWNDGSLQETSSLSVF